MKKTRFFLIAAVAALAMAFTSCGGGVDKSVQGFYATTRVEDKDSSANDRVITFDFEAKTGTVKVGTGDATTFSFDDLQNHSESARVVKIGAKKISEAYLLNTDEIKDLDSIEFSDANTYDVSVKDNVVKGTTGDGLLKFTWFSAEIQDDGSLLYIAKDTNDNELGRYYYTKIHE